MAFPAELFISGDEAIESCFLLYGFRKVQSEISNVSGSHYSEYERDGTAYCFIWNAKEEWLSLRSKNNIAEELLFRNLPRGTTLAQYEKAMNETLHVLQNYFTSSHHSDDDEGCMCGHHHP